MMVEMELVGVRIQMPTNSPVMILREVEETQRVVPIFIGGPEAHAIDLAVTGQKIARPMTHDLFVEVVNGLGASIERVEIVKLVQGTFYANIYVQVGEEVHEFSARTSDAVALAVRSKCTILADEAVVSEAGVVEPDPNEVTEDEEVIEELRQFLDTATPEDFS